MFGVNALSNSVNGKQTEQSAQAEETKTDSVKSDMKVISESDGVTSTAALSTGTIEKGETIYGGVTAIDVSDVVEACMPEVVAITNTTVIKQQGYNSFYDYFYGGNGRQREYTTTASGSGVIVHETDEELLIVTNKHVVEGASELEVTFIDGKTAKADLKGDGGDVDIAVIAIQLSDIDKDTKEAIKIAKVHEEDDLKPGQGVIAIGNALGYGQSVTVGVISALEREIESSGTETYTNLIQTDAAINPGNSGGALLNNQGELIGINVAKLADTEIEGVGFAIPLYTVKDVITDLYETKTKKELATENQGRLGIYMNTISSDQSTALNMPAGVIILGFSDEVMKGYESLGQQYSPAKEAGLQKNDIIVKFDGQTVTDAQSLSNMMKYYEAGSKVDIVVERINNGEYEQKTFTVTLGGTDDEKTGVPEEKEEKEDGEKKEEKSEKKPSENEKPEEEAPEEEAPGEEEEYGMFGGSDDYSDMYDMFRKYFEQYQR